MKTLEILAQRYPMFVDLDQLAEIINVKPRTVRKWHSLGKLPFEARKINGTVRISLENVVNYFVAGGEIKKRGRGRPRKEETVARQIQE
jgi:hypothetical protein